MLDDQTLDHFRQRLLDRRAELQAVESTGSEAAETVELDQTRVGRLSRMDALQGQAMSIEAKRRREIELQRIGTALRRLDEGEYGYCVRWGEAIAVKRLEIDPSAPLCIDCANAADETA